MHPGDGTGKRQRAGAFGQKTYLTRRMTGTILAISIDFLAGIL